MKMVGETRTMVKDEYYDQVFVAENGKPANYIRINRYSVEPGEAAAYRKLRGEITKPLFEEFIARDHMAGWSLWHKETYDNEFQYVSVDAYAEFGQWKSGLPYEEVWK